MKRLALAAAVLTPLAATAQEGLRPAAEFETIADPRQRSMALFEEAGKVIQHPRCVNCHPAGDRPLQGDDGHLHIPAVQRGEGGIGVPGLYCTTCHQQANYEEVGVPGHPEWHLAPIEMAWAGKSLGEICAQLKDPARNGDMAMAELVEHMAHDFAGRLGLAARHGPRPRARHAGRVRRADRGLGRDRRPLPAKLAGSAPIIAPCDARGCDQPHHDLDRGRGGAGRRKWRVLRVTAACGEGDRTVHGRPQGEGGGGRIEAGQVAGSLAGDDGLFEQRHGAHAGIVRERAGRCPGAGAPRLDGREHQGVEAGVGESEADIGKPALAEPGQGVALRAGVGRQLEGAQPLETMVVDGSQKGVAAREVAVEGGCSAARDTGDRLHGERLGPVVRHDLDRRLEGEAADVEPLGGARAGHSGRRTSPGELPDARAQHGNQAAAHDDGRVDRDRLRKQGRATGIELMRPERE